MGPGEKLSPPDIAASLGVSVTPVREGGADPLAAEGLVYVRLRRGTRLVAPMSADDLAELYDIRLIDRASRR